jgi:hypothetical protein
MAGFEDGQLLSESEIFQNQVTMPIDSGNDGRENGN